MEALNKNKEEIEKILKGVLKEVLSNYLDEDAIEQEMEYSSDFTDGIRKGIIKTFYKTSILWCEDEIRRIEKIFGWLAVCNKNDDVLRVATIIKEDIKQIQTHLTWLKEQEKKQ